ncbi:hypothetical protein BS17DRAFT_785110 [Gyrodon lividus]|nr:hypothetical protein BS17DRAFT_785110 [Gyrodon lividus]
MSSSTKCYSPLQEALRTVHSLVEETRRCREQVDTKDVECRGSETSFTELRNQLNLLAATLQSRQNQGVDVRDGSTAHALLLDILTQSHRERKVNIKHFAAECRTVQEQGRGSC